MSDKIVAAPVQEAEAKQKVKREPKPKAPPKPPRLSSAWTEETWEKHLADLSTPVIPDGWINMATVCKKALEVGIKTSRLVSAAGGDRAKNPIWDPVFEVKYVGSRKYMSPSVLTDGFSKLLDPTFHPARVGRAPKDPNAPEQPKKIKIKAAPKGEPTAWIAPKEPENSK